MLPNSLLSDGGEYGSVSLGYCTTESLMYAFYKYINVMHNTYSLSDCVHEILEESMPDQRRNALKIVNEFLLRMCDEDGVNAHNISCDVASEFLKNNL